MSAEAAQHKSPLRISLGRFMRNELALACTVVVLLFAAACIVGPWLLKADPAEQFLEKGFQAPSARNWLGTDALGRDLLVRCLMGGRISLAVGLVGTLVSVVIGVAYGATAGYLGGRTDDLMMRFVDVLYGLPYMLFVVLIMAVLGRDIAPAQRILAMFIALGAVQWLTMARIVRGEVVALKEKEFVEGIRSVGARGLTIIFRFIFPNVISPVLVQATWGLSIAIMIEAALSFLGLGTQPPMPSWGLMLNESRRFMELAPWMTVFPGLSIMFAVLAFNLTGDALRDALDPRLSQR